MNKSGLRDIDLHRLNLLQRILVTTDGTVTDMLSAAFLEPIVLVALEVTVEPTPAPIEALNVGTGETAMRRRIVLRGQQTGANYAYAETWIATGRLAPEFRKDLVESRIPIGELWQSHRLETWKERPTVIERPAGAFAVYLDVREAATVIQRTYRVFTGGRPTFLVTEYFPADYRTRPE